MANHLRSITASLGQFSQNWRVILAAGLAHFTHDGFADMLYVLFPIWQAQFALTFAEVGFCKLLWSGTLAVCQVPSSMLATRLGDAKILLWGTAVTCLAVVAFGWAPNPWVLAGLLVIGGIGESVQHPLAAAMISNACCDKRLRRTALSAYNFTGDVGKLFFPAAAALLIARFGWPTATGVLGVLGLLVLAAIYIVMQKPAGKCAVDAIGENSPQTATVQAGPGNDRAFWLLVCIGVIDSATRMGFLTFFPFLFCAKGVDIASIGLALSLIFLGGAAGKLVCGIAALRFGILRTVIVTEVVTALCIWGMLAAAPLIALLLAPVLGVALNGTSSVLYGSVPELVSEHRRNQAFSIFYSAGIGAGAVSPFLYGLVSDVVGVQTTLAIVAAVVLFIVPLTLPLRGKLVN